MSVDATGLIAQIGAGWCYLPDGVRITSDSMLTATGTMTANSYLHAYAYLSGTFPALTPALELSATAPSATYLGTARTKSGDQSRRYLGSFRVGPSGTFIRIRHGNPGQNANRVEYIGTNGLADATAALLLNGINQTATVVDASSFVPPTSTFLEAQIENTSTLPIYFGNPDLGTVSSTFYLRSVRAGNGGEYSFPLSSTQQFSYIFGAGLLGLGVVNIRTISYFFDR